MIFSVFTMLGLVSLLIIAHELGHFTVARRCGVRVERFGFGLPFGPTLWSKKFGETEYCIHPLLFGGYVSFPDDNPDSTIPKDSKERLENQPAWNRFCVMVAGVTVNAILGWLLMTYVFLGWGIPTLKGEDVKIVQTLSAKAPAAKAGILANDKVLSIEGIRLSKLPKEERLQTVSKTIQSLPEKPVHLSILRAQKELPITVTPSKEGTIGIQLQLGEVVNEYPVDPIRASGESFTYLSRLVVMNFEALGKLITGKGDPSQLSGPIRIVDVGSQMIQQKGIQEGLRLSAIISVILAVMNLLPIPALDGGHILFLAIEVLKGSPVKREIQEGFVQVGFMGLLALMGFVLWNDIYNTWLGPLGLFK
ncbi:MAG: RIP metalloprotease RseP [Cyanobacteria bacterium]|nr:RIP metalloprotease RseP [Cyanobacteriota bacterium]